MKTSHVSLAVLLGFAGWGAGVNSVSAQTAPAAAPAADQAAPSAPDAPAAPPPGYYVEGIRLSGQLDAGFSLNPMRPSTGLNFGQLFTDHANQAQLNQLMVTASKLLDPKNADFQWGFKVQFMYGSDARYTQMLGEFNNALPGARYQMDLVEANALLHLPYVTEGGIDLKVGQYSTPLGYETIDPSTNPFYSHSYVFQFGLPFQHTGALSTWHINDTVDIYGGVDTGANTTFGPMGDDNGAVGGITGVNLTLMGGNLTILALTHLAPEQATRALSPIGFNANGTWRAYNDIVLTYKASDALTLVQEWNWVRDSYGFANKPVNGFGVAHYASYALNDNVTLNARAEVWRDDSNFFVTSFSGNNDPVRFQQGLPLVSNVYGGNGFYGPGGNSTYTGLTAGLTYKPDVPAAVTGLILRPEVRWDHAFDSYRAFNSNYKAFGQKGTLDNITFSGDVVLTF